MQFKDHIKIQNQMKLEDIYFPVEKVPSDSIAPGYTFPNGINNAIVINTPKGEKKVVNYCSDIYFLVKNQDIIPPFMEEIKKHWAVDTIVSHRGYTQFFIDFILKDKGLGIMKDDKVFPRVRLANSYDSKLKYHFDLGFLREICTNGMTIPYGSSYKLKKLHTPSLDDLTSFEAVMEMTSNFLKLSEQLSEGYFELTTHKVRNIESRIDDVLDATRFSPGLRDDVLERLEIERQQLKLTEVSDWLVYNAFNYQLNHNEDLKTKELKKEDIDAEVLNFLINY